MIDRDPLHLHPIMREIDQEWEALALSYGIGTALIETHRDNSNQEIQYRRGRLPNGTIFDRRLVVTWKKPGYSWHNINAADGSPASLACHRAIRTPRGLLGFGESKLDQIAVEFYKVLARIGVKAGAPFGVKVSSARSGADWDRDQIYGEPGEWDFIHLEWYRHGVTPLQAQAAINAGRDIRELGHA